MSRILVSFSRRIVQQREPFLSLVAHSHIYRDNTEMRRSRRWQRGNSLSKVVAGADQVYADTARCGVPGAVLDKVQIVDHRA